MDQFMAIEQRQRNLRIVLFVIILATLPFYCAGILLLGTAPANPAAANSRTQTATFTPIGRTGTVTATVRPTNTPFGVTTALSPLQPTPFQFQPGAVATRYLSPTPFTIPVIPTSTNAPTLTPYPTNPPPPTQVPPTNAPPPTNPPEPTPVPLPTQVPPTDVPPPTVEEPTPLPPPSDTPQGEVIIEIPPP